MEFSTIGRVGSAGSVAHAAKTRSSLSKDASQARLCRHLDRSSLSPRFVTTPVGVPSVRLIGCTLVGEDAEAASRYRNDSTQSVATMEPGPSARDQAKSWLPDAGSVRLPTPSSELWVAGASAGRALL